jgi:hypothetical protein
VRKNPVLVGLIVGSASLVPLAGITALTTGVAGAKTPKGITCTTLSGKVNLTKGTTKETASGCTGKTGGSGTAKGSNTATSVTTKWANGKSTTFTGSSTAGTGCPSGDYAEALNGTVSADTTGSTSVGAAVTGTLCYNPSTSKVSLAPGTKFIIAG